MPLDKQTAMRYNESGKGAFTMTKERRAEIARLIEQGEWLHVTGSRKNIMQTEFYDVVEELLHRDEVRELADFTHHRMTTRYQHCLNVSYYNYKLCRLFRLDADSAARAGLLHDLYHYDTARYSKTAPAIKHSHYHPQVALEAAEKLLEMNDCERDMIGNHMWPVTVPRPKYAETYIITFVDKYCAVIEYLLPQPARFGRYVRNRIYACRHRNTKTARS